MTLHGGVLDDCCRGHQGIQPGHPAKYQAPERSEPAEYDMLEVP